MAYQFNKQYTATFEVPANQLGAETEKLRLAGISATETDANVICNGISSLLAIGDMDADFSDGLRTVKENVNYV